MGVLDDKVAIVTGSARGIGRATAELLSEHGRAGADQRPRRRRRRADGGRDRAARPRSSAATSPSPACPTSSSRRPSTSGGGSTSSSTTPATRCDAPDPQDERRVVPARCSTSTRSSPSACSARPRPTCASRPRRSARRAARSSARSSTSPRSPARWATPARRTTPRARPASSGLTKTLAKEWGQFKINVNAVAFGYIETRLTASKDDSNVMEIGGEKVQLGIPDQLRGMAAMLIPLGRPGNAGGGGGRRVLPVLAVVELRARPDAERDRRAVHRDDDLGSPRRGRPPPRAPPRPARRR